MLTGTDETRGLEEWNVNTIAHLESETPWKAFLPCGTGVLQLASATNSQILTFVLLYSNHYQQHQ